MFGGCDAKNEWCSLGCIYFPFLLLYIKRERRGSVCISNESIYRSMIHTDIHTYIHTYIHIYKQTYITDIPTIRTLQNQDITLIETFLHKYLPKGSSRAEPSLQATGYD